MKKRNLTISDFIVFSTMIITMVFSFIVVAALAVKFIMSI